MNRYEAALGIFAELAKKSTDSALKEASAYQAAWCCYNMGDEKRAADEFAGFVKNYPHSIFAADGLFKLAVMMCDSGRDNEAAAYLREFLGVAGDPTRKKEAFRRLAKLMAKRKDYDARIEYLRMALDGENTEMNAQIQYEIAEAFEAKGSYGKALEEYEKVFRIYAEGTFWCIRARLKSAAILEKMKRPGDARALYETLAAMDVEESAYAKKRIEYLDGLKGR
jgi:predicted negative regulator of RcsB-dependent stress response